MSELEEEPIPSRRLWNPRWYVDPRAAGGRIFWSVTVGVAFTLLVSMASTWNVRAMVGWDAASFMYLVLAWMMILRASPQATKRRAAIDDPGRVLGFFIAVSASLFSLFAAISVLKHIKDLPREQAGAWTALGLAAVALSWLVTHTVFTLRYAHLYYRRNMKGGCLKFPDTDRPCDLDFAYFAFTIGMCFQVSDVTISSSRTRGTVLLHALISFVYNTTILALSLNLLTTTFG